MFRHTGKFRTYKHNLRIAVLLSLVAGIVNVTGFLAIGKLTTNVTGHFAFFIDDVARQNFFHGLVYLLYILSFLAGAFFCGIIIESTSKKKIWKFLLPLVLETLMLIGLGFYAHLLPADVIACSLLFVMGLQNALVTRISNAVVRTTHLTGLFTDLGIELSQLLFGREKKLVKTIMLRLNIILFFFIGGLVGGFIYSQIALNTLTIAAMILIFGLLFDHLKLRVLRFRRKNDIRILSGVKKGIKKAA